MSEEEKKEGELKIKWLTIPRGTAVLTGSGWGAETEREIEEKSEKVKYYPQLTREVEGRLFYHLVGGGYIAQESKPLGEGKGGKKKRRFLNRFGTPIITGKRKIPQEKENR